MRLGEKRLTMVKSTNSSDFSTALENAFPKLKACGGYALLRTPPGSRISLEVIPMPPGGFTSTYLADENCLQQFEKKNVFFSCKPMFTKRDEVLQIHFKTTDIHL